MKETELKPCPFCGGIAQIESRLREWDRMLYFSTYVQCVVCHAQSKEVWDIKEKDRSKRTVEVIEAWNRRA